MVYLLKMMMSHSYVSLPEGIFGDTYYILLLLLRLLIPVLSLLSLLHDIVVFVVVILPRVRAFWIH